MDHHFMASLVGLHAIGDLGIEEDAGILQGLSFTSDPQ